LIQHTLPFLDVSTPIPKSAITKIADLGVCPINEIADEAFKDGDPLLHLPAFYNKMPISVYGDIRHGFAPMDRDSLKRLSMR
jgi:hypothetical protein